MPLRSVSILFPCWDRSPSQSIVHPNFFIAAQTIQSFSPVNVTSFAES